MTTKKIKELLNSNSYEHIANDKKIWKFFRKSDYYQYLKDDLKAKKDDYELDDNIHYYGNKFGQDTRYLNLF